MSISSRISSMEEHVTNAYNVGADLTNVNKNIENISMVLDDIYDSMPQVSGEGTSLTLDDTRVGKIKSTLKGNTSQETTTGKNLIGTNYITGVTVNDTTTNDITIRGNWASTIVSNANLLNILEPSTTYTISYKYKVLERPSSFGTNNSVYILGLYDGSSGLTFFGETQKNTIALNTWETITKTFTTPASLTNYRMIAYDFKDANNTTTGSIEISELQIEKGSSATSFEPYTNGASPNPDYPQDIHCVSGDNTITSCGRNLAYTGWAEDFVSRINNSNRATITTKDNRKCLYWIASAGYPDYDTNYMFTTNWKENTQYTISFDLFTTSSNGFGNICIEYTDGTRQEINGAYNTWIHKTTTSTSGKTIKNIHTYYRSENSYIDLDTFMVYEGTETLPYEPYQGNTYNVDLPVENLMDRNYFTTKAESWPAYENQGGAFKLIPFYVGTGTSVTFSSNVPVASSSTIYAVDELGRTQGTTNNINVNTTRTIVGGTNGYVYLGFVTSRQYYTDLLNGTYWVQIEVGSKANSYTPYGTTPIELCKIGNYQDYIYKDSGKWYLHKEIAKYIFTGNETGVLQNSGKRFDITCLDNNMPICINNSTPSEVSQIYCNILLASSGASTWGGNQGISYNTGTNGQILVSNISNPNKRTCGISTINRPT